MLPDFPGIKDEITLSLTQFLRKRAVQHLGPGLSDVKRSILHEGRVNSIVREDGSKEETEIKEASAEFSVSRAEIPDMTLADILLRYDSVARKIASQQAGYMFEAIDKGVKRVGNVIDNRGKPIGVETLFSALEKIEIDFDSSGNPNMPQMISGSGAHESMVNAAKAIEESPDLKARWNRLLSTKREQWRAREANRELVG